MTKKLKESKYTNEQPPYMDKKWVYNGHNSIMARFKAMGWIAPSEKKNKGL